MFLSIKAQNVSCWQNTLDLSDTLNIQQCYASNVELLKSLALRNPTFIPRSIPRWGRPGSVQDWSQSGQKKHSQWSHGSSWAGVDKCFLSWSSSSLLLRATSTVCSTYVRSSPLSLFYSGSFLTGSRAECECGKFLIHIHNLPEKIAKEHRSVLRIM